MSPNLESKGELQPVFKVLFRDELEAVRYRRRIEKFLCDLIRIDANKVIFSKSDLKLEVWDEKCDDTVSTIDISSDQEIFIEQTDECLFTIDTEPKLRDDLDVPMYGKKFVKALDESKDSDTSSEVKNYLPKITCFNCMGNHSMRECTKAHNRNRINQNRREHFMKTGSRNARYHVDEEQKFGHLEAGKLSTDLRKALGLKDQELPEYIYRMRRLGYPPGWLEEARLQHSGLALFNSEGNAELGIDEEPGELVTSEDRDRYDFKKIVDFPGFNIEAPQGTCDLDVNYWGSEAQEFHSKSKMLQSLSSKKKVEGYKRKKLPNTGNAKTNVPLKTKEMDIDESGTGEIILETVSANGLFIPPLPKEDPKPPEPPTDDSISEISQQSESSQPEVEYEDDTTRDNSPSLGELERTKNQLLAQLKNDSSTSTNVTVECIDIEEEEPEKLKTSEIITPLPMSSTPKTNRTPPAFSTPITERGHVKSVDFGTPILKSTSPFSTLPSSDKFSKDICDVINFENLPDATGKYEQMSGLIQKVRTKLSELHKE